MNTKRIGCIDVGTNTLRLVIGESDSHGHPQFIFQEIIATRLGEKLAESGELSEAAMNRTVLGLQKLQATVTAHQVNLLEAYATAWARVASNTDAMLSRFAELNLPVWILTEEEEASMALEAVKLMPEFKEKKDFWAIDIGGGSTEIIQMVGGNVEQMKSLPIGAVNVTEQLETPTDVIARTLALSEAKRKGTKQSQLGLLRSLKLPRNDMPAVALGGTAAALGGLKVKMTPDNPEFFNAAQAMILETKWIAEMLSKLASLSLDERKALPGMEHDRADILIGGTIILRDFLETIQARETTVCLYSFIHGLLANRLF